MAQTIPHSRRILAVSLESSAQHLARLVQDLTGTAPDAAPLAGTTHELALKTNYYDVTVPIWLDVVAAPAEWAASFLSEEARQVLDVLGGFVVVFELPGANLPDDANARATAAAAAASTDNDIGNDHNNTSRDLHTLLRHMGRVVHDGLGGWEWDGVRLAVGVGEGDPDEWEEVCAAAGLEFVQVTAWAGSARDEGSGGGEPQLNEFGEKTGVARIREALEANDWALEPSADDLGAFEVEDDDDDDDDDTLDFGIDKADLQSLGKALWDTGSEGGPGEDGARMTETETTTAGTAGTGTTGTRETMGTSSTGTAATAGHDDSPPDSLHDEDVAKLERMMRTLQAAREMGEGMGEAQRKRLAARAVRDVMQDLEHE